MITSKHNPLIKTTHALLTQANQRKKLGKTVLEGTHLLDAYLNKGLVPKSVIIDDSSLAHPEIDKLLARLDCPIYTISQSLYKQIRTLGDGLPIMATIDIPTLSLGDIHHDCLIINGVQDNGNLGTLLRTASAIGFETVICTKGSASAWSPKTLRAGMGANFSLKIYENISLDDVLHFVKTPLYATSSHTNKLIYDHDLRTPVALIMGHEGQGVNDKLMQHAHKLALPQPNGQESLNVGVAGSVCLYEILRQRHYRR